MADSGVRSDAIKDDPIARRSATTFGLESGTRRPRRAALRRSGRPGRGENGPFLLLSTPLQDVFETVDFVERTILIAGLLAFGAALLVGFTAANVFARRIRRLERAADRIASGRFDEPIVDTRTDEVGELARAFERMRERLVAASTTRDASSSPTRRTSSGRRSSRSAATSSSSTTRSSTKTTRREFVGEMRAQVDRLGKLTQSYSTFPASTRAGFGSSGSPSRWARPYGSWSPSSRRWRRRAGTRWSRASRGSVWALGDSQRVLQVARSLVENALRHTPEGTTVTISAQARGDMIELVVEDDGPGHPARASPARVRALLPRRRRDGVRQRPRAWRSRASSRS